MALVKSSLLQSTVRIRAAERKKIKISNRGACLRHRNRHIAASAAKLLPGGRTSTWRAVTEATRQPRKYPARHCSISEKLPVLSPPKDSSTSAAPESATNAESRSLYRGIKHR